MTEPTNSTSKLIFISYRRSDSSTAARSISETLERAFNNAQVFIDTDSVRIGEEWPTRINHALSIATVMIVIIGADWLKSHDEYGRRRLDDPLDWVRLELIHAIENKLKIIPLLVSNAEVPAVKGLPDSLVSLVNYQAFRLRDERWQNDIQEVLDILEKDGFLRNASEIEYPTPHVRPKDLSEEELQLALSNLLGWRIASRVGPKSQKRVELMRTYKFISFEDAMHFMMVATRHISNVKHHPDWENVWKSVTIRLTTWDIEHKPSVYDVELAHYFDKLYRNYEPVEEHETRRTEY